MHTDAPARTSPSLERRVVNGPTMGTRFSAVFFAPPTLDIAEVDQALTQSVAEVDGQMSTWKAESDLMRFNRAPVSVWVDLPARLLEVIEAGLDVGRLSGGAFDIGVLELVHAWGFGSHDGAPQADEVARLTTAPRRPAYDLVQVDRTAGRAIKHAPVAIDLSGIAKGYGVDRLAETLINSGVRHFLVSIDGEVRAQGGKPDGSCWRVAVEKPDPSRRDIAGVVDLIDGAMATSGNYRHRRELSGRSYAHTIDPRTGTPVSDQLLSATVRAPACMVADAWATVVMVLGEEKASPLLAAQGLSAMTIGPS